MFKNKGRTGYAIIFGNTLGIIKHVEFELHDYFWYQYSPQDFSHEKKSLGKWLEVAHRVGQEIFRYVFSKNRKVINCSTV